MEVISPNSKRAAHTTSVSPQNPPQRFGLPRANLKFTKTPTFEQITLEEIDGGEETEMTLDLL
jgi:hypothetical protein